MVNKQRVSCIICAYNEAKNIGLVLAAATQSPLLDEIIVVDDGSIDATAKVIQNYSSVHLVQHSHNQGKAAATQTGLKKSTGDLLVFLDADLVGLTEKHIELLLAHHFLEECVTFALLDNTWPYMKFIQIDPWVGERVIPRFVLEQLNWEKVKGYNIEASMNQIIIKNNLPIYSVKLKNVSFIPKTRKEKSFWQGWRHDWQMYIFVYRSVGVFPVLSQFTVLPIKLKIKLLLRNLLQPKSRYKPN